jgi:16S rRNA (adenine1518-N6/adenine1519-N6)-dimethyltransferase
LFRVSPAAFHPRPRVDSTVLSLELRREPRVPISDESRFRSIVRASFGQRRKTLRNALSAMASAAEIERAGIDPGRRGETLTLEEFARLANALTVGAGASRNA